MPSLLSDLAAGVAAAARRAACAALAAGGPPPAHVALIMDGNRRFAARAGLGPPAAGHAAGYASLLAALEWCLALGVTCVSVYAFSVDNWRRPGAEVGPLMALAEAKLRELAGGEGAALLARHGVRVRVLGELAPAPAGVRAAAAAAEAATAGHRRATLNVCLSYTSSWEMHAALGGGAAGGGPPARAAWAADGGGRPGAGGLAGLDAALAGAGCPPVDLLVRTSGEARLSDFLLWQSRHALLVFSPALWPEFGFWHLADAVARYQRAAPELRRLRAAAAAAVEEERAGRRPAAGLPRVKVAGEAAAAAGDEAAEAGGGASPLAVVAPSPPRSPSSPSSRSSGDAALDCGAAPPGGGGEGPARRRRPRVAAGGGDAA